MDDVAASIKPPCFREDAMEVVRILRAAGYVAYFAGGCVRDLLLGLEPKDYDVATDAHPPKVRSLFRSTQAVGQAFGVILVRLGKSVVEVATFRSDGRYLDGRRPEAVTFTTAEEDAKRRDFTINGLFLDPVDNRVIDYVGGQADLAARVLRAIGDPTARFEEDHLRLLRAVRFAARFGLAYDAGTARAIAEHARQLVRIEPDRVGEEARQMLSAPSKHRAYSALLEFGLIEVIFRFIELPKGPGLDVFPVIRPELAAPFSLSLAAAVCGYFWIGDDGRDLLEKNNVRLIVQALRKSLRLSNKVSDALEGTLEGAGILLRDEPLRLAQKKRFLARPAAGQSREIAAALATCGLYRQRVEEIEAELGELEKTEFAPPPLVNGDHLTNVGMKPGPLFKRVLEAVYDAQLEGRVTTMDEAMTMAMEITKGSA